MRGRARAPGAGTVLNALASGCGSAFAIDAYTTAEVELHEGADGSEGDANEERADGGVNGKRAAGDVGDVTGEIAGEPDADARLIERCVELVVERFGEAHGGHVRTESELPMAAGLKSSSAAANATVLATLEALDATGEVGREDAARIGVEAARDVGVTVTGAFDDASASMLGGVTVTDNTTDELLSREAVEWDVLVWTPPERAYSADADVDRCARIAPVAEFVAETALDGRYAEAMTVNGFAFAAALGFSAEPLIEALPEARGVSLSGTGPSVTAIGEADALADVEARWSERAGRTWLTTTQNDGAQTT